MLDVIKELCVDSLNKVNKKGALCAHKAAHHGHVKVLELLHDTHPESLKARNHHGVLDAISTFFDLLLERVSFAYHRLRYLLSDNEQSLNLILCSNSRRFFQGRRLLDLLNVSQFIGDRQCSSFL